MKNLKPASLLILVIFLFSACKKDAVDYSAYNAEHGTHIGSGTGGTDSGTTTAVYYFKGTLGGKTLDWIVDAEESKGWSSGSASNRSSDKGVNTGSLTAIIDATQGQNPNIGVEFRTMQYNFDADKPAFLKAFVATGAWTFDTDNSFTVGTKTISIQYTDAAGNQYSSDGVQTGSANVVSADVLAPELGRNDGLKIKVTFSCTLYALDGTSPSIQLTNAEAVMRLEDLL
ncbi:hypothetical protein [Mucilaginibacter flavidus]|uniref:hypothetical protein n=1 Tax=Mucilaginibacter flavidus TaxID=2949309 RepID=UPI0020920D83|nr:hypothetical protein [Mucilaginibacter flavidus]MCO5949018.1 hypothetical protein [Mucilaginibacter flavidus]